MRVLAVVERHSGRRLEHKWLEMPVGIAQAGGCPAATLNGNSKTRRAASGLSFWKTVIAGRLLPLFSGEGRDGVARLGAMDNLQRKTCPTSP